ncbi:MAG: ABC transporter permease [Acidobacteriota bacterium]
MRFGNVPLSYNFRSLLVRKSSTLLTVFSIAATVAVLASLLALQSGFATAFSSQGREDLVVFMRQGATSEGESAFPRASTEILIKGSPEIASGPEGPLASAELYLALRQYKLDGGETNVPIRGVQSTTFDIHGDSLQLIEGRRFTPGADEIIVGKALVDRVRNCRLDDVLVLNTTPFRVVGVFDSRGAHVTEIWGDADRLLQALDRPVFNRVIGQIQPGVSVDALQERLDDDPRVPCQVSTEKAYLESQTLYLSGLLIGLGTFLAAIMGGAAVLTGTNSLLAAVSARGHEIGILRSLGFSPRAVFFSFLFEALLLGLIGGLLGCLLVLPLNGLQTGTTNFQTFTETSFAFRFSPVVLVSAVVFACLLGLVGGAIPAFKAARMSPTQALRRG